MVKRAQTVGEAKAANEAAKARYDETQDRLSLARDAANAAKADLTKTAHAILIAREREYLASIQRARYQAKKLAAQHGIEIERDNDAGCGPLWWVTPPEGLYADEEDDPHNGCHLCAGWFEILEICKTYAKALEEKSNV